MICRHGERHNKRQTALERPAPASSRVARPRAISEVLSIYLNYWARERWGVAFGADRTAREDTVEHVYQDVIFLIEKLHRHFLEVVKAELDRIGVEDINNVQALILFNIGKEELTVGELTNRGYYLGSNVSYNVKKMVENDYLIHKRSTHDRRSIHVRLSDKGLALYARLTEMFERHTSELSAGPANIAELHEAVRALRHLEQFWTRMMALGFRGPVNVSAA